MLLGQLIWQMHYFPITQKKKKIHIHLEMDNSSC